MPGHWHTMRPSDPKSHVDCWKLTKKQKNRTKNKTIRRCGFDSVQIKDYNFSFLIFSLFTRFAENPPGYIVQDKVGVYRGVYNESKVPRNSNKDAVILTSRVKHTEWTIFRRCFYILFRKSDAASSSLRSIVYYTGIFRLLNRSDRVN